MLQLFFFSFQLIFFSLFLGIVMHTKEFETKDK